MTLELWTSAHIHALNTDPSQNLRSTPIGPLSVGTKHQIKWTSGVIVHEKSAPFLKSRKVVWYHQNVMMVLDIDFLRRKIFSNASGHEKVYAIKLMLRQGYSSTEQQFFELVLRVRGKGHRLKMWPGVQLWSKRWSIISERDIKLLVELILGMIRVRWSDSGRCSLDKLGSLITKVLWPLSLAFYLTWSFPNVKHWCVKLHSLDQFVVSLVVMDVGSTCGLTEPKPFVEFEALSSSLRMHGK